MDINMTLELNSIVCTVIQAGVTIATALIARKIVKDDIAPIFQSYSDRSYDLSKLIKKASRNIVFIGASGYRILKDYGSDIEERLDCGVSVYYLFLEEQQLLDMERYRHGDAAADENIYLSVKEKLREWCSKYNSKYCRQLRIREFSHFMTAAYVGVDIPFGEENCGYSSDSVIQVVQYQYGRSAKDSPLTYLHFKRNRKQFMGTIDSINKMWAQSKESSISAPEQA